ncbi:hypothetical protein HUT19_24680 [Streptomyces sp. NA02950]|uniref:hypothetical protein n=1 Tax=Streptomyces sp. NA02950 TaxID=2742137 RepID=UPI001591D09B|nr:hypothetical protein [Streptomyces sp. NA02950]QKV94556.1 hypothetical protein HUT19_24680 [Streptomyces sp. NA02950]
MDDVTPLLTAVDRLADRLRTLPQSRLRQGAAAEGLALARELSLRAQRLEKPGAPPRIMPDVGMFAVADQLAVAGHDLVHALERAPDNGAGELAEAVTLVTETAERCGA